MKRKSPPPLHLVDTNMKKNPKKHTYQNSYRLYKTDDHPDEDTVIDALLYVADKNHCKLPNGEHIHAQMPLTCAIHETHRGLISFVLDAMHRLDWLQIDNVPIQFEEKDAELFFEQEQMKPPEPRQTCHQIAQLMLKMRSRWENSLCGTKEIRNERFTYLEQLLIKTFPNSDTTSCKQQSTKTLEQYFTDIRTQSELFESILNWIDFAATAHSQGVNTGTDQKQHLINFRILAVRSASDLVMVLNFVLREMKRIVKEQEADEREFKNNILPFRRQ